MYPFHLYRMYPICTPLYERLWLLHASYPFKNGYTNSHCNKHLIWVFATPFWSWANRFPSIILLCLNSHGLGTTKVFWVWLCYSLGVQLQAPGSWLGVTQKQKLMLHLLRIREVGFLVLFQQRIKGRADAPKSPLAPLSWLSNGIKTQPKAERPGRGQSQCTLSFIRNTNALWTLFSPHRFKYTQTPRQ